jgi:exonuclease VII large subunit
VTHAASTPSRSAEMVLPSLADMLKDLQSARQALSQVPVQLGQSLERVQAHGDRLRRSDLLESRGAGIAELSQRIARMESSFFGAREKELGQARATLETVPHRCLVALSARERGIGEQRLHLGRAPKRTEEALAGIADQARVVDDGIARQLADHERDYGRAIDRLITDFNRTALRRFEDERTRLGQARELTRERIGHRFDRAERDLKHVTSVIEARDFRRHGFVLATDASGKPVPSISGVRVGAHLDLKFRDGRARVAVRETKEEEA